MNLSGIQIIPASKSPSFHASLFSLSFGRSSLSSTNMNLSGSQIFPYRSFIPDIMLLFSSRPEDQKTFINYYIYKINYLLNSTYLWKYSARFLRPSWSDLIEAYWNILQVILLGIFVAFVA